MTTDTQTCTRPCCVVTDQIVEDTLVTAFEGGSNYWIAEHVQPWGGVWPEGAEYAHEVLTKGKGAFHLRIVEGLPENRPDKTVHILTLDKMRLGILKMADHVKRSVASFEDDPADATFADVALQFALLDEIRYG